jgi:exonuclease VII large subunit
MIKSKYLPRLENLLKIKESNLSAIQSNLLANNPKTKVKKGFAQLSKKNKVVSIDELEIHDNFELQSDTFVIKAKVLEIKNKL